MKNEKNIAKLTELVDQVKTCMFTTVGTGYELAARPMHTTKIEDDGSIWFFTNEYTEKTAEISKDSQVVLAYSHPSNNTYLTVNGRAELVDDRVRKEAYFNPMVKAWFPDGLEDPRLTLIKVTPETAEYWDASANKMVVLFQMLKAVVTGEQADMGTHEKLGF